MQVSRWLVGVKRLVQEVRNVEAPLSPSSDCHNDVEPSLSNVLPSLLVPADCSSLVVASCQSADATMPLLDVSGNSSKLLTEGSAVGNNTHKTVTSSSPAGDNLSSETFSFTFTGHHVSVADSAAVNDTPSSSCDMLPARETQLSHVSSVGTVTPADSVTMNDS